MHFCVDANEVVFFSSYFVTAVCLEPFIPIWYQNYIQQYKQFHIIPYFATE